MIKWLTTHKFAANSLQLTANTQTPLLHIHVQDQLKVIVKTTNKHVGSPCLNVPYSVLKGHYVTVLYIK